MNASLRKYLLLTLCGGFISFACDQRQNPDNFLGQRFDQVYAYKMNGRDASVVEEEALSANVIGQGKQLGPEETLELLDILHDPESSGDLGAMCFEPRIGYVFYDNRKRIIAHVTICIECSRIRSVPALDYNLLSPKASGRLVALEETVF